MDVDEDVTRQVPLQNNVIPRETYGGVINVGDTTVTGGAHAMLAEVEITHVANVLHHTLTIVQLTAK